LTAIPAAPSLITYLPCSSFVGSLSAIAQASRIVLQTTIDGQAGHEISRIVQVLGAPD